MHTIDEIREWADASSLLYKGSAIAEMLTEYAAMREAQEKAVPVTYMLRHPGCVTGLTESEYSAAMGKLVKMPAGCALVPLFTHPPAQAVDVGDLRLQLDESTSLLVALLLEPRPHSEIEEQICANQTALNAAAQMVDVARPTTDEVHAWRDRNDLESFSTAECRAAMEDAMSMHAIGAALPESQR